MKKEIHKLHIKIYYQNNKLHNQNTLKGDFMEN